MMNLTKLMAWLLLALGVGLGMLALRNATAQTATSSPLTPP